VQGAICICRGTTNVTMVNTDAGHVWIAGDNAKVIGGDYGPQVDKVSKVSGTGASSGVPVKNTLIDGAYFHDYLLESSHMECLNVESADGLIVRNSRFNNCAVFGILKEDGTTQTMRNVTIENNWFSNTGNVAMSNMIKVTPGDSTCQNIIVRNNSVALSGSACGGTNMLVADAGYADRAGPNLHLRPDSPAINRGGPTGSAPTDIDGQSRPMGPAPDAGADEAARTRKIAPAAGFTAAFGAVRPD
jgi:hypothetical protein